MSAFKTFLKDPNAVKPFFFVWCDRDGTNDGSTTDRGELQGETISSYTITVDTGLTKDSDNKAAIEIHGVSYAINTVVTVWLSGGTVNTSYNVLCRIVTSGNRTLDKTLTIKVQQS